MRISCQDFLKQLYAIENLDDISVHESRPEKGITEEFLDHLSNCESCRTEFEKLKKMNLLLKDSFPKAEHDGISLSEKVSDRIRNHDVKEVYSEKKRFHVPYATLTAAALVLVMLASSSSWIWNILPGSTKNDEVISESQGFNDIPQDTESSIYYARSAVFEKKDADDKSVDSDERNDTLPSKEKSSEAKNQSDSFFATGTGESKKVPEKTAISKDSAGASSGDQSANADSATPMPFTAHSEGENFMQIAIAPNDNDTITGSAKSSEGCGSSSEPVTNIGNDTGENDVAITDNGNSDAADDASDATLFATRSTGGSTGLIPEGEQEEKEFSQEFYDTVNEANAKAKKPIPIELFMSVGEEAFFKWYDSIRDFEEEYTEEHFREYFKECFQTEDFEPEAAQ